MTALTFRDVSFSYSAGRDVIRGVSLDVLGGEILTLVGPNGSGKSTLIKLATRLLKPGRGSIDVMGQRIDHYAHRELARLLAVVPQDGAILFPFTVEEVVLMGRVPHGAGRAFETSGDLEIARDAMEKADIAHLSGQPVTRLSGGERQRVHIARALAQQPSILLLDEPNAHLDIAHQVEVFNMLRRMNAEAGLTVLAVSHDLNLAAAYADRIAVINNGEVSGVGRPDTVLTEETIRSVFRTEVLVDTHPHHLTPRVTLTGRSGKA